MKIIAVLLLFTATTTFGQAITGKWKTIDDNSGEAKSIVEIFEKDGKYYGKIVKIFLEPNEDPDPVCDKCEKDDPRYNKKIIGMEIIKGLEKDHEEFSGGNILDPENGKVYRCRLWVEGGDLMVRGYWGPFFRTQTWKRV
jgi:uncharacterized protein (DUF2147 family)